MKRILSLGMILIIIGCQENNYTGDIDSYGWSLDIDFLRQGCYSGSDCIPSLEKPSKSLVDGEHLEFLDNKELIVGVWNGTEYVAYPHSILDWHEIVNEEGYSISYCPLTGSAIHIATESEFGVSGLLFNSNLIMYDRETGSLWPQMLLYADAGDRKGANLSLKPIVETSWENWKSLFPETAVINSNTGFDRNYDSFPYGEYKSCNSTSCSDYIYFPVANLDDRLEAKDRVLTLIAEDSVKALSINAYASARLLNIPIGNTEYKVVISGTQNIATAFESDRNLLIHNWDIRGGELTISEQGTSHIWDITGRYMGAEIGVEDLPAARSYIAYWFSVAAIYPEVEIILP